MEVGAEVDARAGPPPGDDRAGEGDGNGREDEAVRAVAQGRESDGKGDGADDGGHAEGGDESEAHFGAELGVGDGDEGVERERDSGDEEEALERGRVVEGGGGGGEECGEDSGEEADGEGHPERGGGPEVESGVSLDEDLADAGLLEEAGEGGDGVGKRDELEVVLGEEAGECDLAAESDEFFADTLADEPEEAAGGLVADGVGGFGGGGYRGGLRHECAEVLSTNRGGECASITRSEGGGFA